MFFSYESEVLARLSERAEQRNSGREIVVPVPFGWWSDVAVNFSYGSSTLKNGETSRPSHTPNVRGKKVTNRARTSAGEFRDKAMTKSGKETAKEVALAGVGAGIGGAVGATFGVLELAVQGAATGLSAGIVIGASAAMGAATFLAGYRRFRDFNGPLRWLRHS